MKTTLLIACAFAAGSTFAAAATPNLNGIWTIVGYTGALKPANGEPLPLKPEAKAKFDKHLASAAKGDVSYDETSVCIPPGLPRLLTEKMSFQILQRDKAIYFVHQDNRLSWRAYVGEQLPADPDPLYLGYSVAKWDGPILNIESAGFLDSTLMDDKGLPHSDALHLSERWSLGKDGKILTATIVVDDPKTFTHPWTAKIAYRKEPASFKVAEDVCVDRLQLATLRPTLQKRPSKD